MGIFSFLSPQKEPNKPTKSEVSKPEAPVLDGFWEIKFGSSLEDAKRIMESKPGCVFRENGKENQLMCLGLKFAGKNTFAIRLDFWNNKFHSANVYFEPSESCNIIELYNEIKSGLNKKYFATPDDFETYVSPFKKGDGNFEDTISSGNAIISSFWSFKNPSTDNKDLQNCISIYIKKSLMVELSYQDTILVKGATAESEEKNNQDY